MKFFIDIEKCSSATFEVEADDYESARETAIDMAYDHDWSREEHLYRTTGGNGRFEDLP